MLAAMAAVLRWLEQFGICLAEKRDSLYQGLQLKARYEGVPLSTYQEKEQA